MSQEIVTYEAADGATVELTPQKVISDLVRPKDRTYMTDQAVSMVMAKLSARRMNPLAGDCSIGVLGGQVVVMPSIDYYRRVADAQGDFDGLERGTVCMSTDGKTHRVTGAFVPPGWSLLGAWCKAYSKSRTHPAEAVVAIQEYDQHNSMWESKPATMICKVAESQALRMLYPGRFGGTYTRDELPDEQRGEETAQAEKAEPEYEIPDFGGEKPAEETGDSDAS